MIIDVIDSQFLVVKLGFKLPNVLNKIMRNHYLPICYLSQFTDSNGKLFVSKNGEKPFTPNLKNFGLEKDLYSGPDIQVSPDEIKATITSLKDLVSEINSSGSLSFINSLFDVLINRSTKLSAH